MLWIDRTGGDARLGSPLLFAGERVEREERRESGEKGERGVDKGESGLYDL